MISAWRKGNKRSRCAEERRLEGTIAKIGQMDSITHLCQHPHQTTTGRESYRDIEDTVTRMIILVRGRKG